MASAGDLRQRTARLRRAFLLALLGFGALALGGAPTAGAVVTSSSGTCHIINDRTFRVSYQYDSDTWNVKVTNIQVRSGSSGPYSNFYDSGSLASKMEWWTSHQFQSLLTPSSGLYANPAVGLSTTLANYKSWWGAYDGRSSIIGKPVNVLLNPRVEFRSDDDPFDPSSPFDKDNPLDRAADSCDVYLANYAPGADPPTAKRVAHIGDSISVQMAPQLFRRNIAEGHKYFLDPQSGQSFATMLGEERGIAGGIRDGATHVVPNVLILALGTNDVGAAPYKANLQVWQDNVNRRLLYALVETNNVPCRVLMTVRERDYDPASLRPSQKILDAAKAFNATIKNIVAGNASRYRLVDWNQMSASHRPGSAQPWFSPPWSGAAIDPVHPNTAGLDALTVAFMNATDSCLGA